MKSGVFLVAFCARLKTYGALFGDKNHKAFSRFCLCGHEKSGLEKTESWNFRAIEWGGNEKKKSWRMAGSFWGVTKRCESVAQEDQLVRAGEFR